MARKKVCCHYCGRDLLVSTFAFSVVCPNCCQRLSVEDYIIKSYREVSGIDTCGTMLVTQKGDLRAKLRVRDLDIQGRVNGTVQASGKVTVAPNAHLEGNITARSLEVNEGAHLNGYLCIEPKNHKSNGNNNGKNNGPKTRFPETE